MERRSTWKLHRRKPGDARAEPGESVGGASDVEVEVSDEPEDEDAPPPELQAVQTLLGNLRGPVAIQLYRRKPTWCAGFLDEVHLNAGEELDLRQLKADWGGGEIQLRPRVHTANGTKWAKGGGVVKFTGPPRERGRVIDPSGGYHEDGRVVVETRPVPVKPAAADNQFQLMGVMFNGMMELMKASLVANQRQQYPAMQNPMVSLEQALLLHRKINKTFFEPEDEEDEETPAEDSPLGKLIEVGLKHLDKKESQPQENKGFRLHKANPDAPAANQRRSPAASVASKVSEKSVIEFLRSLPEEQRMELLGSLSAEIPPDVIQAWMAENMGGKVNAS